MPVMLISPNYTNQILNLVTYNSNAANGTLMTNQRSWALPVGAWSGDTLDIPGLSNAFDRSDINAAYAQSMSTSGQPNGGRISDIKAGMLQVTYLAGLHRSYATRYYTPIRASMHRVARQLGHADPAGILQYSIANTQEALALGYSGGDTGVGL